MSPCNTIRKKPSITTQLSQLFNVRLYYMFRPYMAISMYYNFIFFKTNFHKATHFSNNNNNNNNNSLITETTWDSQQNSCHNCVTPPKLQPLFARHKLTCPARNTT